MSNQSDKASWSLEAELHRLNRVISTLVFKNKRLVEDLFWLKEELKERDETIKKLEDQIKCWEDTRPF